MAPKIVGALLCRNEADKYLERVLENASQFCDEIVVVDDGSTDRTRDICNRRNCLVLERDSQTVRHEFWGSDEGIPRRRLWEGAAACGGEGGWIYVFDADQELIGISPEDFRTLCKSQIANCYAFALYDCWDSDETMRVDGYWQAHHHPRPWLFRAVPHHGYIPSWTSRGIHVGHYPHNYPIIAGLAPEPAAIRHLGYIKKEHREEKAKKYLDLGDQLTEFEKNHAKSILEVKPTLEPIPPKKLQKILIGSVVRKPANVVGAWLKTLEWQEVDAEIEGLFVANYLPSDRDEEAIKLLYASSVATGVSDTQAVDDGYKEGPETRHWTPEAWHRMGSLKNGILEAFLQGNYDYVWLVDADVLCDPWTLQSLLDCEAQVVSGVYWTQWMKPKPNSTDQHQHAGPQVWARHPYFMDNPPFFNEATFRSDLIDRKRLQVAGLGACTLIHRSVIEKGVNFSKAQQLPPGPMSDGEDRHFCWKAAAKHVALIADAWPNIYHAYHPSEYQDIPSYLERLSVPRPTKPSLGNLVNFTIKLQEPVKTSAGLQQVQKKWVRGRMGSLKVLPQIEESLAGLSIGESKLIRLHYPWHYDYHFMRGETISAQIKLLDIKEFSFPPVIDKELYMGSTGTYIDAVTLTDQQHGILQEDIASG